MNVKTMSKSLLSSIIVAISLVVVTVVLVAYVLLIKQKDFDCATNVDIHIEHAETNTEISGTIKLFFHFIYGEDSHISEYGIVRVNDKKFILDRTARLHFSDEPHNGYYEVTRGNIEKNPQDNVPDDVYSALTSKQKVLFFKVGEINNGFWQIKDLRRTLIICKKMNSA